jgi:hypothetical protein
LSVALVGKDEKIALSVYMRRGDDGAIDPASKALFEALWETYKH